MVWTFGGNECGMVDIEDICVISEGNKENWETKLEIGYIEKDF